LQEKADLVAFLKTLTDSNLASDQRFSIPFNVEQTDLSLFKKTATLIAIVNCDTHGIVQFSHLPDAAEEMLLISYT
jgi:hypothetical protein